MIAEISAAITTIQSLMDIAAKTNDHEFKIQLNSLYESLMVSRVKILELEDENANLKSEIRHLKTEILELKDESALKKDLEFKGFGLFKRSNGNGPFCNPCWNGKGNLVNLHYMNELHFNCPSCKEIYCTDPEAYQRNIEAAVRNAGSSFNKHDLF